MGSYIGQGRQASRDCRWIRFALFGLIVSVFFQGALCEVEPTESQCRPYIEKALKEQHLEVEDKVGEGGLNRELIDDQEEFPPTDELTDSTEGSLTKDDDDDNEDAEVKREIDGDDEKDDGETEEETDNANEDGDEGTEEQDDQEAAGESVENEEEAGAESVENEDKEVDDDDDDQKEQEEAADDQETESDQKDEGEEKAETEESVEEEKKEAADDSEDDDDNSILDRPIDIEVQDVDMDLTADNDETEEEQDADDDKKSAEDEDDKKSVEADEEDDTKEEADDQQEGEADEKDDTVAEDTDEDKDDEKEKEEEEDQQADAEKESDEGKEKEDEVAEDVESVEKESEDTEDKEDKDEETEEKEDKDEESEDKEDKEEEAEDKDEASDDKDEDVEEKIEKVSIQADEAAGSEAEEDSEQEAPEEEELIKEVVIPDNLRPRDHIDKILKLEDSAVESESVLKKTIDTTLKGLKNLYDNAIKPLEMLYKYRDLSNRHFGDPEIFSKPLILFMGPWSGGKSSTINYLLDNEFSHTSLKTGAEPSPAYFNILMYGEEEEILDGTQLAADWTFSGLQKFGQGLLDRLKGIKLPNKLLEKVNIVEIPGILEIRKQVQRLFPFNDACQWFIDRADIIFLVYDPSKLDVGPETEAILDQLKGREYQTRIILNKADQVKPEELMRVQGTLIWNISPLMSSSEPPIMYSTSLWSLPYEAGAPTRLLQAQERAFLRDLREAIDKRVENKISSARRFAVRVRNHAKMVDCYLTTYYNHKSIFGNRKKISDDIIEYPQKYHIYEGLSTLTNISRYDLPDPDVYRDFFKINPLYEFKKLSETCTYFRGCPINQLDVAIAYDLPELVGKYKKEVESTKEQLQKENS